MLEQLSDAKKDTEKQLSSLQKQYRAYSDKHFADAYLSAPDPSQQESVETTRHLQRDIESTQRRLDAMSKQTEVLRTEVSAAKNLLSEWR